MAGDTFNLFSCGVMLKLVITDRPMRFVIQTQAANLGYFFNCGSVFTAPVGITLIINVRTTKKMNFKLLVYFTSIIIFFVLLVLLIFSTVNPLFLATI